MDLDRENIKNLDMLEKFFDEYQFLKEKLKMVDISTKKRVEYHYGFSFCRERLYDGFIRNMRSFWMWNLFTWELNLTSYINRKEHPQTWDEIESIIAKTIAIYNEFLASKRKLTND